MGDFGIKKKLFNFAEIFEKLLALLSKISKIKLQEYGIEPWLSTNKHISCEQTNHKDNKRTVKSS
jgi:hypothetical protein